MTFDDIKFVIDTVYKVGVLTLLGCILLELRDQRITWMLRKSMRREWVRKEHSE